MFKLPMLAVAGTAALALAAAAPQPASAASVHLTPALGSPQADSHVLEVQRRWRGGHRHGFRGRDALIGLGIGSAIIGGALAARPYGYYDYGYYAPPAPVYGYGAPYAAAGDGWAQCQAQFRSLRADGTYTTYDGRQVLCPYLR